MSHLAKQIFEASASSKALLIETPRSKASASRQDFAQRGAAQRGIGKPQGSAERGAMRRDIRQHRDASQRGATQPGAAQRGFEQQRGSAQRDANAARDDFVVLPRAGGRGNRVIGRNEQCVHGRESSRRRQRGFGQQRGAAQREADAARGSLSAASEARI